MSTSELTSLDIQKIRKDFPILETKVHGKPLVYLDNAASAQKPQVVIEALNDGYTKYYSNIHRAVHCLCEKSTELFEAGRDKVQEFISAKHREEIIFVRGTTEAINLVAQSFVRPNLKLDDEILITTMEHHSNIVPWQMVCEQTGAKLKVAPINDNGEIILEEFKKLLNAKTKMVSIIHVSNSLGTINPVEEMIKAAHDLNIPVMLDGAQAVVHQEVNVQKLDCEFYAFSGHKLYGPTGIGVLYGKKALLEKMPPYHGGGEMISQVTFEKTTYNTLPNKFEAGTPHIVGVMGLGAAIDYIKKIGLERISIYEKKLLEYATDRISEFNDIRIIGTAKEKSSILSFIFEHIHAHDVGTILDQEGIAIRTGHHCTMPLMNRLKIPATARASFVFYNTMEEIDAFIDALEKVRKVFL
jgi:cysteine desulfurase/selenocysteine lyase